MYKKMDDMDLLIDNHHIDGNYSIEDISRESVIFIELIHGIVHELSNSLTSAMAATEVLQEEMIKLRKGFSDNHIDIKLVNHIEKIFTLYKTTTVKNQNILNYLLKIEFKMLRDQCYKINSPHPKFDLLQNLISLNMKSNEKIDLIVKILRNLVNIDEDMELIDVNEVINTSIFLLQDELKNKYVIKKDFSKVPLINFSFRQLNYIIICILLKTLEIMNFGELSLKTFETDKEVYIIVQLSGGEITLKKIEEIIAQKDSKIDICSVNKLLKNKGGTLTIKKLNEKRSLNLEKELVADIEFKIKLNKANAVSFKLNKSVDSNNKNENEFQDFKPSLSYEVKKEKNQSKNILIVDDNLETLVSLFLTLKKEDFGNKIIIAKTAEAALEQLQKINFNIIISDYKLPGMSGIDFLSHVKDNYPNSTRILLTAFLTNSVKKEAKNKASVKTIIEKPWNKDNLIKLINE